MCANSDPSDRIFEKSNPKRERKSTKRDGRLRGRGDETYVDGSECRLGNSRTSSQPVSDRKRKSRSQAHRSALVNEFGVASRL